MKRILLGIFCTVLGYGLWAQDSFSDDFEQYTAGAFIAASSNVWSTWSGVKGGADDTRVSNERARSGANSLKFLSTSSGGGPADVILPFGGKRTTGTFSLEMYFYVVANKGAYFNFQGNTTPGQIWSLDAFFDPNGDVRFTLGTGGASTVAAGKHPKDSWFKVNVVANLTDNLWEAFIDGTSLGSWSNPNNSLASMDLFPTSSNNQSEFFVDDVSYVFEPFIAPDLDASLTAANIRPKALTGTSWPASVKIKNVGRNKITSVELEWSLAGGTPVTETFALDLDSLVESAPLPLSQNVTFAPGNATIDFAIKKVNGTNDDKAANNAKSVRLEGVTPAPDKKIVVEEATGTWCQWCPRGAVYLDSLSKLYPEHFIGIAVHNRDPMAVAAYDAGLTTFPGFTGFPQVVTNRRTLSDPSAIEPIFYNQIVELSPVVLDAGAAYDAGTRKLTIEAKAHFAEAVSGDYRFNLVIAEDGVRGTASGYNQSNAYAGGANGVMGGYELLPNPVPAARMVYNHVGRAILDGWAGQAGFLPADIPEGTEYIKSWDFTIPAGFTPANMKLVAMMLDPNGEIINAAEVSFDDAIAKGLFTASEDPGASADAWYVFPNPAEDLASVYVTTSEPVDVSMQLRDAYGRELAKRSYGRKSGSFELPVQMASLDQGNYFVVLTLGQQTSVKMISVIR
ncbi:MAG: Omp28-related outer membrane protein [Saprospiraceae bacterium]|nr:Omp28-related outer membrane protein [Saprospiraceae bacterium]